MTKSTRLLVCSAITFTLAMPGFAEAQARARGDSGSSGSASGSSGSSSSGGSSERSAPEPSAPSRPVPQDAPRTGFAMPRGEAPSPAMPSGDRARPADRDSGNSGTTGVAGGRSTTGESSPSRVSPDPYRFVDPSARPRDGRPTTGFAVRRSSPLPSGGVGGGGGSWSDYYPWYGSGFNWYYPSYGYAYPYGGSRWVWGRYGMWSDLYDPFGYYGYGNYRAESPYMPYGYGYGGVAMSGYGYGSSTRTEAPVREATGSIRVRVSPRQGKVYVDGTLMGTVDEFDGLRNHLATTAGAHEIEIRADGYQPLRLPVDVAEDKTVTVRGSLKKN